MPGRRFNGGAKDEKAEAVRQASFAQLETRTVQRDLDPRLRDLGPRLRRGPIKTTQDTDSIGQGHLLLLASDRLGHSAGEDADSIDSPGSDCRPVSEFDAWNLIGERIAVALTKRD